MKSIHQDYQLLSIMLPLGGAARRPPGCYLRYVDMDTVEILIRSDCGLDIILSVAFYTQVANFKSKYKRKNRLSTISYFTSIPFLNKKKNNLIFSVETQHFQLQLGAVSLLYNQL